MHFDISESKLNTNKTKRGIKVRKICKRLDTLLRGGYFYNREWVRCGKYFVDICMEFEHFLTKRRKYLYLWWSGWYN